MTDKRHRLRMRDAWLQVHLWLGLTLGVVGALLGISGSLLVYDDVLDGWLHPARHAITAPAAGPSMPQFAQRAEETVGPGARATGVRMPDLEAGPVVVFVRAQGGSGFQRVYLDPPTARVLDVASGTDFLGWLHNFHGALALRDSYGREIVGVAGIAMLISSLTGLYLWWPRGRWRNAIFGFRRNFPLHRNLHYTFGLWGLVLLTLLSFTGIVIAFPDASRTVVAAFSNVSPSPRSLQASGAQGKRLDADAILRLAQDAMPQATPIGLGFPQGPTGVFRVSLREPGDTTSRSGTAVYLDPVTGRVLHRTERATRTAGDGFLLWQRLLHEGGWLGGLGAAVTFAGGILPPLLMVSGLLMWLRGRRWRAVPAAATASAD
ncbi:MAG: PepSY-associated TM helix domain-containing protein [Burkholderiales bacterium]